MSSGTVWIWSTVFTGWIIKLAILKLGGLKMYRRAVPFFFSLVLGDYIIGFAWSIIGLIFDDIGLSYLVLTKIILTSIQQKHICQM